MPYDGDVTWNSAAGTAEQYARSMIRLLNEAKEAYTNWQTFRDSRTNAQIAAALNKTEAEIADLDACYAVFSDLHSFADNDPSPTQQDRLYALRKFV
jgi:hypothetical protein